MMCLEAFYDDLYFVPHMIMSSFLVTDRRTKGDFGGDSLSRLIETPFNTGFAIGLFTPFAQLMSCSIAQFNPTHSIIKTSEKFCLTPSARNPKNLHLTQFKNLTSLKKHKRFYFELLALNFYVRLMF